MGGLLDGQHGRSGLRQGQSDRPQRRDRHPAGGCDQGRHLRPAQARHEHEHAAGLDETRHRRRRGHQAGGHHGRRSERNRRDQGRARPRSRRPGGPEQHRRNRLRPGPSAVDHQPGRQGRHQPEGSPQGSAAQPRHAPVRPHSGRHHRGHRQHGRHGQLHHQEPPGRPGRLHGERQYDLHRCQGGHRPGTSTG